MESFLRQLKKLHNTITFDAEKKAAVRAELVSYLRGTGAVRAEQPLPGNYRRLGFLRFAVPVLLVVLVGAGTSLAAEGALPGDTLYPIKVNVNEKVAAVLATSPVAKAQLGARLAERRLQEADSLAAQGKLDAATDARIAIAFQSSVGEARSHIKSLKDSGDAADAAEISSDLESKLQAHTHAQTSLAIQYKDERKGKVAISVPNNEDHPQGINVSIGSAIRAIMADREDAEAELAMGTSTLAAAAANAKISAVADALSLAQAQLADETVNLDASTTIKIAAELASANELILQARAKFGANAYGEAFTIANQAAKSIREAVRLASLPVIRL